MPRLLAFMFALLLSSASVMAAEDANFEDVLTLGAQGDLDSIFSVGVHYLNGDGVTKNEEEAIRWLELAANSGHVDAQTYLDGFNSNEENPY